MRKLDPDTEAAVRDGAQRVVGIAALRRIGRLVRGFEAEERFKRRASRAVLLALALVALALVLLYVAAPGALSALFRSLS